MRVPEKFSETSKQFIKFKETTKQILFKYRIRSDLIKFLESEKISN